MKFTEMMIGRWDERKGLAQQYQSQVKDFLLRHLAFTMHMERATAIALPACRRLIEEQLKLRGHQADTDIIFDEILYRSNLLRVQDDEVVFRHPVLQEFFAGRGAPSSDFFAAVSSDVWWRTPMVFYFGENPADDVSLLNLAYQASGRSGPDIYEAAITIGLALQACYLTELSQRTDILEWVVNALAEGSQFFLAHVGELANAPMHAFIRHYLHGRDAVASEQIIGVWERTKGAGELHQFWCIVGHIEAGRLREAEELLEHYRPEDGRLLLALFLGCYFTAHLRLGTEDQKRRAERMCDRLMPKIQSLLAEVTREMKSLLLEVRRGEIRALEAPKDAPPLE